MSRHSKARRTADCPRPPPPGSPRSCPGPGPGRSPMRLVQAVAPAPLVILRHNRTDEPHHRPSDPIVLRSGHLQPRQLRKLHCPNAHDRRLCCKHAVPSSNHRWRYLPGGLSNVWQRNYGVRTARQWSLAWQSVIQGHI